MPGEDGRSPLSPFWWNGDKKDEKDADDYDPPPLSPLWWNKHDHHGENQASLLHRLGLNDERISDSDKEPSGEEEPEEAVDEEFQRKVNAAYETLPPTIRALPDFPSIEILEEPRHPKQGREVLGRFFGIPRSKKSNWISAKTPTMIHVYRGPVLRYLANQATAVDAVLKTVVWHEVAHWLGFTTEKEVAELGLQLGSAPKGSE